MNKNLKNPSLTFRLNYFILFLVIFFTEVLIAMYAHDQVVRPYVGDLLVVILIYCFLQSFLRLPFKKTAIGVLIFSFIVEILQYFKLVELLGLQHSTIARIVIGTSFQWIDLVAYTAGIFIVLIVERRRMKAGLIV